MLNINNVDSTGVLGFSTGVYNVNENGGSATITVVRTGGSSGAISVNYATLDGSAIAGVNYASNSGTLFFGVGELSKSFTVPIHNDGIQDPSPFFFTIALSGPNPASVIGFQSTTTVKILDVQSYNQPPGNLDSTIDPGFGVNGNVRAMALEANGRLLVGGDFTTAGDLQRNRIARFNNDGTLDLKFSTTAPTDGANGSILAMLCQSDQSILIGGQFTTFNSVNRNYLARLTSSSLLDSTFNPGSGPDGPVFTLAETFANSPASC